MFYTLRLGLPCLTEFVHQDLVGHGCQADEKNAQQGHLSLRRNDMAQPQLISNMDVSWAIQLLKGEKCSLK